MIDSEGYRYNVGIIIVNPEQQVLWARRARNEDAWQFPQGGVNGGETEEEAMYRELQEEVGLKKGDVTILGVTAEWLHYRLPKRFMRVNSDPVCVGQKQKWFLLQLQSSEANISLNNCNPAEFDAWCWVDYWYPAKHVIQFKQKVYHTALTELAPLVFK